jgi:uncharacterized peroxidase-related enzyme
MSYLTSFAKDSTLFELFDKYPHIYALYSQASRGIMRGPSPLSFGERELLGAFVSAINGCDLCFGSHVKVAELFGQEPNLIKQLLDDIDSAEIDDKLKPLFHYIQKLTKTPTRITQADADKVYAAGWDEDALHNTVAVCCTFQFMNHLVLGMGIDPTVQDYDYLSHERFETRWQPMKPALDTEAMKEDSPE